MTRFIKRCLSAVKIRAIWLCCRLFPVNNHKITISSFYGRGYGDNAKYIVEKLLEFDSELRIIWLVKNEDEEGTLPAGVEACKIDTVKSVFHLMTSKVWIDNCRKFFIKYKKRKQFYIQTWHGFAFKQIERDAETKLSPDYVKSAKRDSKNIDLIISCSRFMTGLYKNSFWYNGRIWEIGAPRNDILLNEDNSVRDKVNKVLGVEEKKKIILYAPTFRADRSMDAYSIDYKRLKNVCEKRFGGEFVVVARLHPNIANKSEEFDKNSEIINGSLYPDMQELMAAADVLITDYSSVMFDYALTYKPCFLFASDISDYIDDRGFYFSFNELPFSISSNNDDIEATIFEFDEDGYKNNLQIFFDKIGMVMDGTSSEKCAKLIIKKCCSKEKKTSIAEKNSKRGFTVNVKLLIKKVIRKISGGTPSITEYRQLGAQIGENCHIYGSIDSGHEFLVTMGNNVTLASGSRLLTHDGSTKKVVGYSKVGRIDIGDDVFIGAAAIVLPNVKIGSRVIMGAGSVVTKDIPDNSVAVGNPAKVVGTYDDFVKKNEELIKVAPVWNTHYSKKTDEEKHEMKQALLESGYGFDV